MNRIKELREAKGISMETLAKAANIDGLILYRIEAGKETIISTGEAKKIAEALGVSVFDIFA